MFAVMLGLVMVASPVSTMGSFYLLPSPVLAAEEGGSSGGGGGNDNRGSTVAAVIIVMQARMTMRVV